MWIIGFMMPGQTSHGEVLQAIGQERCVQRGVSAHSPDAQMPTALRWQRQGRRAPRGPAWCFLLDSRQVAAGGGTRCTSPSKSQGVVVSRSVVGLSADLMDCSPPGSSVHGILQARILEWVAISFSRGSSRPKDRTRVSCIASRFFTV